MTDQSPALADLNAYGEGMKTDQAPGLVLLNAVHEMRRVIKGMEKPILNSMECNVVGLTCSDSLLMLFIELELRGYFQSYWIDM